MIVSGVVCETTCSRCKRSAVVDLQALRDTRGPYYSLFNRRAVCTRCGARTRFWASVGGNHPQPLFSGGEAVPAKSCGWCGSVHGCRPADWWAISGRREIRDAAECPGVLTRKVARGAERG